MKNKMTKKLLAVATGAVMLAGACVAGVSSPSMQVEAATGNVTVALKQSFDPVFYANRYPDVQAAYGMNEDALFNHFIQHGMSENRMMNASFDPRAYLLANPDVNSACHGDASKAYEHYVMHGITENRILSCDSATSVNEWWKAGCDEDFTSEKKITKTVTKTIEYPFDDSVWSSLSASQKETAIRLLVNYLAEILEVPVPAIVWESQSLNVAARYSPSRDTIFLNPDTGIGGSALADVIIHEMRHKYQYTHINDDSDYARTIKANDANYITLDKDPAGNLAQPIEMDAINYVNSFHAAYGSSARLRLPIEYVVKLN